MSKQGFITETGEFITTATKQLSCDDYKDVGIRSDNFKSKICIFAKQTEIKFHLSRY